MTTLIALAPLAFALAAPAPQNASAPRAAPAAQASQLPVAGPPAPSAQPAGPGGGPQNLFALQPVLLQPTTPGTPQVGNVNVTGVVAGGTFQGNGSQLVALDASNLSSGLVPDARLASNISRLNGAQTFTGSNTFSSAPAFTAVGAPFSVASGTKVANLNCDQLDGLDSSAFLQAIPTPLVLQTNIQNTYAIWGQDTGNNFSTASGGVRGTSNTGSGVRGSSTSFMGVFGESTSGYGVYGLSTNSNGVMGSSSTGNGVAGSTGGSSAVGVVGSNSSSGNGVRGTSFSGVGVRGIGSVNGVQGEGFGNGSGVYGEHSSTGIGVAGRALGNGLGVYGDVPSGTWGLYTDQSAYVGGNLLVGGSKGGYVVDLVRNGGDEPLERGDLVEIAGYEEPRIGEIPVIVVRKASARRPRAVLGPIDCAIELRELEVALPPLADGGAAPGHAGANTGTNTEPTPRVLPHSVAGPVQPGAYANVVTLGAFAMIRVDASTAPIEPGDPLVASVIPGLAASSQDPLPCTVIGKALGRLDTGFGTIPVFIDRQ